MKQKRTSLKELVAKEQIFAPCIWDCRTAKAAKMSGFKAALLSGGELSESICGVPDIGLITADDLVQASERICQYSDLPKMCIRDRDNASHTISPWAFWN